MRNRRIPPVVMREPPRPLPARQTAPGMTGYLLLLREAVIALETRDLFPRIDTADKLTVSVAGTDQDFLLTGVRFGTEPGHISATLGGLAMTVQVDPADTTITLRLASGAGLTVGSLAVLHFEVESVPALPVQFEVVA